MPARKRIKTKYPGVHYVVGNSTTGRKSEKIYYIMYRRDGKLVEEKAFYTSNDCLFYCDHCKNLYEYTKAMENGFICCEERVKSFDSDAIVQGLLEKMAYIEDKLGALSKI